MILGLRMRGADKINGADLINDKSEMARKFGIAHFVNPTKVERSVVDGNANLIRKGADQIGGVDYRFDLTGNDKVMRDTLECTYRGRCLACPAPHLIQ